MNVFIRCARCGIDVEVDYHAHPERYPVGWRCEDCRAESTDVPPMGEWVRDALCAEVGPELFFPTVGGSGEGRLICARCPVRPECESWAAQTHAYGIWGGRSERQRGAA